MGITDKTHNKNKTLQYRILSEKMSSEKFCLRWNDFEKNISSAFKDIREDKEFFDITIACEDEQLQAHKLILSACSPFFKGVLRRNQHQHPLLYLKGVTYRDMEAVLNFMYHGEVNVAQEDLNSFLQVAEDLRVKGLTQNNSNNASNDSSKREESLPKSEPRIDSHTAREHHNHNPNQHVKQARPSSSAPRILPQRTAEDDDDIEEIVPVVKSEPSENTPAVINTNMVEQQQSMAMYDDRSQMMGMEQYDENYAGEYDGHYDQGYDSSMMTSQETSGADNGRVQCKFCSKMLHPNSIQRHVATLHKDTVGMNCTVCGKHFNNI